MASELVYGPPSAIRGVIDHPMKTGGNLEAALRLAAGKHSAVFAMNVKAVHDAIRDNDNLLRQVEPFKPLMQAHYAMLTVDVAKDVRAEAKLIFATEKDAQAALKPARTGLDLARGGLEDSVGELSKQKEMSKFVALLKQVQGSLKAVQVEQEGKTLKASAQLKVDVANLGVVLVQAVQKVRGRLLVLRAALTSITSPLPCTPTPTRRGVCRAHAVYDKNGKPTLSWRVLILPHMEPTGVIQRSSTSTNPGTASTIRSCSPRCRETYAAPQDEKTLKEHTTYYQGFVGKGAFFEGKQGLRYPANFPDGTSNTFMIVEASKAVPWTKPADIPYDPAKPLPKLGLPGTAGFLATLCDGSVRFCTPKISEKTLRLVIERNDGMPIPSDF